MKSHVEPLVGRWLASEMRLKASRYSKKISRKLTGRPRIVHYFHRVDDPYSHLLVQILPEFISRFDIILVPHVVERLPAEMYPDPHRYEALSILDASRLARLYGLGFPGEAMVPDRLSVGMAARHLATLEHDPAAFLDAAQELGVGLWRRDVKKVRAFAGMAELADDHLRENEILLARLGHYASGTLIYEGEAYPGLDRLDHLERRLNFEGAGDGRVIFEQTRHWTNLLSEQRDSLKGKELELFFSLRSPYSYIALEKAFRLVSKTSVTLTLRPVLPMVARGLPVPLVKRKYIIMDAAREARLARVPFGKFEDPLGAPVEAGLAQGLAFAREGLDAAFFRAWMQNTWALGRTGKTPASRAQILQRAGLEREGVSPLPEAAWRARVEANRQDMLKAGCWGVPTFRAYRQVFWGQDRLWAAVGALKN